MSAAAEKVWVLIAESDADTRQKLSEMVQRAGDGKPRIVESITGTDALQKMLRQKFHLVISDMNLPQVNGSKILETIDTMDERQAPTCIIALATCPAELSFPDLANRVQVLPKPIVEEALEKLIISAVRSPSPGPVIAIKMDVNFINPFIEATLNVLATTASTQAEKESVFLRKGDQITGDISAVVAMNSSQFSGSMAISFDEKCFLNVVNTMLGETYTQINSENSDAVGELCNQIFGGAKKTLNERGYDIQPAIPSVIYGKEHRIKHLIDGPCLAVRFRTQAGTFVIEAIFKAK